MIIELIKSFIMLLVIMDPFGGIPVFLTLTKAKTKPKMRRSANRAIFVASILILLFLFFGTSILNFFSITIESFKIAGGIILLILGITYVMDIQIGREKHYTSDITVPMATPLIAGPGLLTAVIISVASYGLWISLLAVLLNLFIFWLLMYYSNHLNKVIGEQGIEVLTRIMGLILTAMSIEFIITGIKSFIAI